MSAHILLVEDNLSDQVMLQRAFEDAGLMVNLHIVNNGREAIDYLHQQVTDRCLPDLILMDINMPIMDGKQALTQIRNTEEIKHIPVIMLTTSNRDIDVLESYQLGVNAYLTKPTDNSSLVATVKQIDSFWFTYTSLPSSKGRDQQRNI